MNYKDAGVDLHEQDMFNAKLCSQMPWLGGFSGAFDIGDHYLISSTDGIGTKLKLYTDCVAAGIPDIKIENLGIDLVAMVFNDIVCCGAKPLFMHDYLSVNDLKEVPLDKLIVGIRDALKNDCAGIPLMGGETAIMNDLYKKGEFDIAGFGVGIVDKKEYIDGSAVRDGDVMLGLFSSGFHSNGFSLIRRILKYVDKLDVSVYKELLTPTRIYVNSILKLLRTSRDDVHAIAHITGGGRDNVNRVIGGEAFNLRPHWHDNETPPEIFKFIQENGNVTPEEMKRVFNNGIGMVLIVERNSANDITQKLEALGEKVVEVGYIKERLSKEYQSRLKLNAKIN